MKISQSLILIGFAAFCGAPQGQALFAGTVGSFDLKDAVTGKILGKVILH